MSCKTHGCKCKAAYRGYCQLCHKRMIRSGELERKRAVAGSRDAFLQKAFRMETNDCILWPYSKDKGYGRAIYDGVTMAASRAMCFLAYGPPFEGAVAAHSCDVRSCVNKRHLRWTTYQGNADDRLEHGIVHRGNAAGSHLTPEQVLAIYSDTRNLRVIAAEYGCGKTTVQNIRLGLTWGWLTSMAQAA